MLLLPHCWHDSEAQSLGSLLTLNPVSLMTDDVDVCCNRDVELPASFLSRRRRNSASTGDRQSLHANQCAAISTGFVPGPQTEYRLGREICHHNNNAPDSTQMVSLFSLKVSFPKSYFLALFFLALLEEKEKTPTRAEWSSLSRCSFILSLPTNTHRQTHLLAL